MIDDVRQKLKNTLMLLGASLDPQSGDRILELTVQSGKNGYVPQIRWENEDGKDRYRISFPGILLSDDRVNILPPLADELGKYDQASVIIQSGTEKIQIEAGHRGVSVRKSPMMSYRGPDVLTTPSVEHGVSTSRDYYLTIAQAAPLLREIGILDEQDKVRNERIRKYNQIDRLVEAAVGLLLHNDPDIRVKSGKTGRKGDGTTHGGHPVHILDCACGKSYLSFALYYYFREVLGMDCTVTGLDISEQVVEASRKTAGRLGYKKMNFMTADLREYLHRSDPPDLCISLHACDVATDYAISTGITNRARAILCVPCCQKELLTSRYRVPELEHSLMNYGILKARFSDLMTDAVRALVLEACGYECRVTEYLSPLDSPKNLLISAVYTGRVRTESVRELRRIRSEMGIELSLMKAMKERIG